MLVYRQICSFSIGSKDYMRCLFPKPVRSQDRNHLTFFKLVLTPTHLSVSRVTDTPRPRPQFLRYCNRPGPRKDRLEPERLGDSPRSRDTSEYPSGLRTFDLYVSLDGTRIGRPHTSLRERKEKNQTLHPV